jgi:hypothetical protein
MGHLTAPNQCGSIRRLENSDKDQSLNCIRSSPAPSRRKERAESARRARNSLAGRGPVWQTGMTAMLGVLVASRTHSPICVREHVGARARIRVRAIRGRAHLRRPPSLPAPAAPLLLPFLPSCLSLRRLPPSLSLLLSRFLPLRQARRMYGFFATH